MTTKTNTRIKNEINNSAQKAKKAKRYINIKEKNKTLQSSKGSCQYTNCTAAHEVFHHTNRFSKHFTHKNNIVSLCKINHEIVHNGFIKNKESESKNWQRVNSNTTRAGNLSDIDKKFRVYTKQHRPM